MSAGKTRQNPMKKSRLCAMNEHFEMEGAGIEIICHIMGITSTNCLDNAQPGT
jgi:hypothetical protein